MHSQTDKISFVGPHHLPKKFLFKKAKATTRLYALPMTKVINRNIGSWCNQHSLCNISGLNTDIQDRMLISIATNWTGTAYCLFFSLIQAKVEPINLPRPFVALVKQQRESGYKNKLVLSEEGKLNGKKIIIPLGQANALPFKQITCRWLTSVNLQVLCGWYHLGRTVILSMHKSHLSDIW